jgi:hypothetical protein
MCLCRKKQNDLVLDKIRKKEEHLNKLTGEYQKLFAYKTEKGSPTQIDRPPETQEEDQNRKVTILFSQLPKYLYQLLITMSAHFAAFAYCSHLPAKLKH